MSGLNHQRHKKEFILCLPECFGSLMESKKLSLHGGKINLAVRYFWLRVVSCVSGYLSKLTRHTVGEGTSLKGKDRHEVLHYSSKVHQSFQTQTNDS